jgi:hypothetical protein
MGACCIVDPGGNTICVVTVESQCGGDFFPGEDCDFDPCPPPDMDLCPWDCGDGNGTVDAVDFLALLGNWGACPPP